MEVFPSLVAKDVTDTQSHVYPTMKIGSTIIIFLFFNDFAK